MGQRVGESGKWGVGSGEENQADGEGGGDGES